MKLTERDLTRALHNSQDASPIPLETERSHHGTSWKEPPPRMWDVESTMPLFPWACLLMILVGAIVPAVLERLP
jgi:hypothetical protein